MMRQSGHPVDVKFHSFVKVFPIIFSCINFLPLLTQYYTNHFCMIVLRQEKDKLTWYSYGKKLKHLCIGMGWPKKSTALCNCNTLWTSPSVPKPLIMHWPSPNTIHTFSLIQNAHRDNISINHVWLQLLNKNDVHSTQIHCWGNIRILTSIRCCQSLLLGVNRRNVDIIDHFFLAIRSYISNYILYSGVHSSTSPLV